MSRIDTETMEHTSTQIEMEDINKSEKASKCDFAITGVDLRETNSGYSLQQSEVFIHAFIAARKNRAVAIVDVLGAYLAVEMPDMRTRCI